MSNVQCQMYLPYNGLNLIWNEFAIWNKELLTREAYNDLNNMDWYTFTFFLLHGLSPRANYTF
jgi:hypothetical protein